MSYMPPVTKNLLIINVLFFMGRYVAARYGIDLDDVLGLHFLLASRFHFYQVFTYMFMHANWSHIFFNMFAVWMFGCAIENHMGSRRFLLFYLTCGLGAALTQEVAQYVQFVSTGLSAYDQVRMAGNMVNMSEYLNLWTTVGASGAVYGILLAFGMTFPDNRIFIFPLPVPIKAKYFVAGYAVIELLLGLGASNDGVAHFAHLGGMLFGFLLLLYWRNGGGRGRRRDYWYDDDHYDRGPRGGMSQWFSSLKDRITRPRMKVSKGGKFAQDMEYREAERQREEEMDRILDKIRKSGYSALSEDEKRRLFDISNRQK
ncbi:MAG: rhomboid family intramembrane serine protease [Bacteroidaceae bacterium]